MAQTANATKKPGRGRPPTGQGTPVQVRLQPDMLNAVDGWIEKQPGPMTRPQAIRLLVAKGLSALNGRRS